MLHSNIDPSSSRLVSGWLALMYALARPLAARAVSPSTVTALGVMLAAASIPSAASGDRWPLAAAVLIVASAFLDGVDGAVAVVGGSESRWGYVLDTVADRVSELCFLGAAYVLGAPPVALVAIGALTLLQETARARAVGIGLAEIGVLTVWERPSRVVTAVVVTVGAGVAPDSADFVALMGSLVGLTLATIGAVQLMVVLRRRLR